MTRKHALFPFVAVFLLGAGVSQAGLNAWSLTGPGGGPVGAVAIHPTDATVVLASAGNGMYRSVDGGLTWTRTGDADNGTDIFFDPANPNRVFVVAEAIRMYRSEDAGLSFSAMAGPPNATPHRLGISGDGTMYMVDRQGHIYRSSDHGLSWTEVAHPWPLTDESVSAIAVDRVQANVLYAAVKDVGTYKSINGGASWIGPIANSPGTNAPTLIFQLVIKPDDPNRILGATNNGYYVSADAGVTWSQPAGDIPLAFAFEPGANNNVAGVSWFGQIVRSGDGGLHWYIVDRGANLQVSPAQRLAYGPANKVIVATADGPMVSTDDGTSFTLRVSGMHAESVRSLSSTDGGVLFGTFVPGPFGIYRRDGGTWEAVGTTQLRNRFGPYPAIQSVTAAPGNPNRLFAVGFSNQLISSFDGGVNWTNSHPSFTSGNPVLVRTVIDPTDQQIVYVLTQNTGVWKSEDGGTTFNPRTTGLPVAVSTLVVDRTNTQILYAGGFLTGATGVFKSVNGGTTWGSTGTLPDQTVVDLVIDPANSSVVYAVLAFSLHKSTDGGASWNEVKFTPANSIAARGVYFDHIVPSTMFIGATPTGAGFSRSVDSGATWQHIAWTGAVLPSIGGPDIMILDRVFSGNIFAGGWGTGLYQYQVSNDLRLNFNQPLSFALGASGSLTIPVQNAGPYDAASPELQFNIPSNITVTVPAGCRFVAPSMVCRLPNISSGATYNFILPYSASATAANLAMGVYLFGREVELTPNDTQVGIAVNVLAMADLGVTTAGTASVQQNQPVTYTATVTNSGPNPSAVTTLTVQVPSGVSIQTRTPSVGTCTATSTSTTCELGVLASGASASVSIVGTALTVGAQAWSGTVTTGAQDSVAANDTASLTTTVTAPPPPVGGGSSSGGGGGGGGRFDWLAVLLLGGLAVSRARLRVSAHR